MHVCMRVRKNAVCKDPSPRVLCTPSDATKPHSALPRTDCPALHCPALQAMSGNDPMDSTCALETTSFVPSPGEPAPLYGAVVGIPEEYYVEELSDDALAVSAKPVPESE